MGNIEIAGNPVEDLQSTNYGPSAALAARLIRGQPPATSVVGPSSVALDAVECRRKAAATCYELSVAGPG